MWTEIYRIRTQTPNLFIEVSARVLILFLVCIMQFNVKPSLRHISDSELYYYMKPRKASYVSPMAMVFIVILIPLLLLCLPYVMTKNYEDTTQSLLAWTMALSLNAFITESTKLIVGRPRPDFYYRCFPTGQKTINCVGNLKDILEGRKSFPSGHSSFAFCSMGFISLWFCGRLKVLSSNRGDRLKIMICLLPLILATVIALSRCLDHHHHWEDVIVGSLLGFTLSYMSYNMYYNPLDSDLSGYSYLATNTELYIPTSIFNDRQSGYDTVFTMYSTNSNIFINNLKTLYVFYFWYSFVLIMSHQ